MVNEQFPDNSQSTSNTNPLGIGVWLLLTVVCMGLITVVFFASQPSQETADRERQTKAEEGDSIHEVKRALRVKDPRRIEQMQVTAWWDAVPERIKDKSVVSQTSNIHPSDYAEAQSCKKCHEKNHADWSDHPHRWMNALAKDGTVKGDFSGDSDISYYGGKATFAKNANQYLMHLERDSLKRTYQINQTIGSRFFQYYIGKQIEGPEPNSHHFYQTDHVLPFGYWFETKEWVPVVHVGPELPDSQRADPFDPPAEAFFAYSKKCNYCHTTFAVGDMLTRQPGFVGFSAPNKLHWHVSDYLQQERPELMKDIGHAADVSDEDLLDLMNEIKQMEAPENAVSLGVSCGACHLGAKEHVATEGKVPPKFFPTSPHLFVEAEHKRIDDGRTHDNVNWACGRCHIGFRPQFAAGMSTWNSVEFSDAMLGSCYSELRCVDCHNPHRRIGDQDSPEWDHSASFDDFKCLSCHEKFGADEARVAHTHHPAGSEGSRCMNCHMPRINEGLQDVVRTHMIYSPTRPDMIEANHPNACNMCHTDRPIDWTLTHLNDWYGATFNEHNIAANYPNRQGSVAIGWIKSDNEAVRLVGSDVIARRKDRKALPHLLDSLDDPFLINRQFASKGLAKWLDVPLKDFGYRFYLHHEERQEPLQKLRELLLPAEVEHE